jgi:hypothetical protein
MLLAIVQLLYGCVVWWTRLCAWAATPSRAPRRNTSPQLNASSHHIASRARGYAPSR